jgi:hypothetical protein
MPIVGGQVLVRRLGHMSRGVVEQVGDGGRTIKVTTERGESISFTLSRATARFTAHTREGTAQLTFA